MNNTITVADELAAKIEAGRYRYFTFPVLQITVKYRKPDLFKLAIKKQLPGMVAEMVIKTYRGMINGRTPEEIEAEFSADLPQADDNTIQELSESGYKLFTELVTSHIILDVPDSDPLNNVISWRDIPEEDAIAFVSHLIQNAQTAKTAEGGDVTIDEVASFPEGKRVGKRRAISEGV